VKKVEAFVITGKEFLVTIGQKVCKWVMSTVTQVAKAISWLLSQIAQTAEKIFQWVGFLFNWSDIKTTKESVTNIANDTIDKGVEKIADMKNGVNGFFQNTQNQLNKHRPNESQLNNDSATANDSTAAKKSSKGAPVRSVKAIGLCIRYDHRYLADGSKRRMTTC
jgi:hypothetical protein